MEKLSSPSIFQFIFFSIHFTEKVVISSLPVLFFSWRASINETQKQIEKMMLNGGKMRRDDS